MVRYSLVSKECVDTFEIKTVMLPKKKEEFLGKELFSLHKLNDCLSYSIDLNAILDKKPE